jgi:hypothetical protein
MREKPFPQRPLPQKEPDIEPSKSRSGRREARMGRSTFAAARFSDRRLGFRNPECPGLITIFKNEIVSVVALTRAK